MEKLSNEGPERSPSLMRGPLIRRQLMISSRMLWVVEHPSEKHSFATVVL